MIGTGLKKLAAEYELTVEQGVAYGWLKGGYVALSEGAGYKRLALYIGCHHAPEDAPAAAVEGIPAHMMAADRVADLILEKASDPKKYRLMPSGRAMSGVVLTQGGSVVQVNFLDNPGTLKCLRAFVEEVLPAVTSLTTPRECAVCGQEIDTASLPVRLAEGAVVPMHSGCADTLTNAFQQAQTEKPAVFPLLPLLGALVGALIGAALWAAVGIAGYMASLVGLVIAFLAAKGYTLLGGRPGKAMMAVLILCVILAVALGNAGTLAYEVHSIYQEAVAELLPGETARPEDEFFRLILPEIWADSEVRAEIIKDLVVGLFFAALGSYATLRAAASKPANEQKPRALQGRI